MLLTPDALETGHPRLVAVQQQQQTFYWKNNTIVTPKSLPPKKFCVKLRKQTYT